MKDGRLWDLSSGTFVCQGFPYVRAHEGQSLDFSRLGRERLGHSIIFQTSLVYILMPETTYIRSRLKPQQLSTKNLHLRELRTQI